MAKNRNKYKKVSNSESTLTGKSVIITSVSFLIICVGMYFLTNKIIEKNNTTDASSSSSTTEFNYNNVLFDNMLTRPYKNYYVIAIDFTNSDYYTINNLVEKYKKKENSNKIYFIDLSEGLNKKYVSDKSNLTSNLSEIKVSKVTMFTIKDGKIVSFVENIAAIEKILK